MNKEKILTKINKSGFVILNNILDKKIIKMARSEYLKALDHLTIHPPIQKFIPSQLKKSPWRKLAIGSKIGSGESYAQLLQTTYFYQNDLNYPNLSKLFNEIVAIRNLLTNLPCDYGLNFNKDDFWNACRVHHYPQGGGHMAVHQDTLFPSLLKDFEIPFIQILIPLSRRGIDFHSGGGYIIKNNKKYFFERQYNIGSIIIFDGSIFHGVDDIDLDKLINFDSKKGRIAIFVNLYKNDFK